MVTANVQDLHGGETSGRMRGLILLGRERMVVTGGRAVWRGEIKYYILLNVILSQRDWRRRRGDEEKERRRAGDARQGGEEESIEIEVG